MKTYFKHWVCGTLIFAILVSLVGCATNGTTNSNKFNKGTYTAQGNGKNGAVNVEVEFSTNKIVSMKVLESNETKGIGDLAFEKLPKSIVDNQSLAVDVVAGATYTSNAIIDAVKDAVTQAGGNVAAMQTPIEKSNEAVEKEADIVVVGAGAAGMMAAINASSEGMKVVILEKGASASISNFSQAGGPTASETKIQAAENATVTTDQLFNHMYGFSHATVNGALLKEVLKRTGDSVDLMSDLGIGMTLIPDTYGVGFRGRHFFTVDGAERVDPIVKTIVKQGGEFLFETEGKKLITNDKGAVVGVEAKQSDGTTVKVKAKAVLVCTGGFLGNKEMLAEHFPGTNIVTLGNTLSTGDGINMVLNAGGVLDSNFALLGNEGGAASSKTGVPVYNEKWEISNQNLAYWLYGGLLLNNEGDRFVNEEEIANEPLSIGGEILARTGKAYAVVDEAYIKACATEGIYKYLGSPQKWISGKALWYPVLDKAPSQIQEAINQGWAYKADSLEELAKSFGLNNLPETVKNYNELAAKGKDTEFGKSKIFLKSINKGPYYVFEYEASAWGTNGGVKVDNKLRALNKENKPITGLYVAGVDAGSMYTSPYYNNEGASLGVALGSGTYAADVIKGFIQSK